MNYLKSLRKTNLNGSNPVGGQVEAGEKTGYRNRSDLLVALKARLATDTAPSAVTQAA